MSYLTARPRDKVTPQGRPVLTADITILTTYGHSGRLAWIDCGRSRAAWADYRSETLGRDVVERLATDAVYRARMRLLVAELKKGKAPRNGAPELE